MANCEPEVDEEPTTTKDVEGGDIDDKTQDIEKLSEEEVSVSASK
jgi:hypothetical protein